MELSGPSAGLSIPARFRAVSTIEHKTDRPGIFNTYLTRHKTHPAANRPRWQAPQRAKTCGGGETNSSNWANEPVPQPKRNFVPHSTALRAQDMRPPGRFGVRRVSAAFSVARAFYLGNYTPSSPSSEQSQSAGRNLSHTHTRLLSANCANYTKLQTRQGDAGASPHHHHAIWLFPRFTQWGGTLNGTPHPIDGPIPLDRLLDSLGLAGKPVVAELNKLAVFPREYPQTIVEPGARLEIVTLAAGG